MSFVFKGSYCLSIGKVLILDTTN